jgi:hypothetical protein
LRPRVLVTRRVYPEAVELLRRHFEVDYEGTDDGLTTPQLVRRTGL